MTHICVGKLSIIGSDNGLSPGRRQAIIWTNAWILLIWPLGTNFNEILIGIKTFSFKKMHLKMSSAKWRAFCLGLNVLISWSYDEISYHILNSQAPRVLHASTGCIDRLNHRDDISAHHNVTSSGCWFSLAGYNKKVVWEFMRQGGMGNITKGG